MHPPEGPAWLVALETSGFAQAMRHWLWLYPIVEIVHILGFVLLIGAAMMFDLRLLGISARIPVSDLARLRLPWSRVGLGRVAVSGLSRFSAPATEWIAVARVSSRVLGSCPAALSQEPADRSTSGVAGGFGRG